VRYDARMAVTPILATVADLAVALRMTLEDDDAYATLMLAQASQAVRDEARQPLWVLPADSDTDPADEGYVLAPRTAQDITLWVAQRAYLDPRNRTRITSGPISDTFSESGVYGLDLTDGERARLSGYRTDGATGGLWSLQIGSGQKVAPITLNDVRPGSDLLLYADPQWAWAFAPRRT